MSPTATKAETNSATVQPKGLDQETKLFYDTFELDLDCHQHQWELVSRLAALNRGKLPNELEGTFSKIMLNVAHAITQERVSKLHQNLFGKQYDWLNLEANTAFDELALPQNEAWLRHMVEHPTKLNMSGEFLARTLPQACYAGTAFRLPYVTHIKGDDDKYKAIINSKHVDFFQILPAANGGMINPMDNVAEDCLAHFHHIDWWSDEQIKALSNYPGYKKDEVAKVLAEKPLIEGDFEQAYTKQLSIIGGNWFGDSKDDWRVRMNDIDGSSGRRRTVIWHRRDKMDIFVNDRHHVYSGPNPMRNGLLNLVAYHLCPDGTNIYGVSSLEMVEDVIRAMMMNFNFRQDFLARVMFPTKWIRNDVMQGKPQSEFYDKPFAIHNFPNGINIKEAIHIDRMPEITPQTFQDEAAYKTFLQDINGLTDYSKGMPGRITDNRTATGLLTMVQQAQGRLTSESFILEKFGIAQECRLLLSLGEKYLSENQEIRVKRPEGASYWTNIAPDTIQDAYTVHTNGTTYMQEKDQSFQKMMALYPLWNQRPNINQTELDTQLAQAANVFNDVQALVMEEDPSMMAAQESANPMQGMSGSMTPNNQEASREGRTKAEAARTF